MNRITRTQKLVKAESNASRESKCTAQHTHTHFTPKSNNGTISKQKNGTNTKEMCLSGVILPINVVGVDRKRSEQVAHVQRRFN